MQRRQRDSNNRRARRWELTRLPVRVPVLSKQATSAQAACLSTSGNTSAMPCLRNLLCNSHTAACYHHAKADDGFARAGTGRSLTTAASCATVTRQHVTITPLQKLAKPGNAKLGIRIWGHAAQESSHQDLVGLQIQLQIACHISPGTICMREDGEKACPE